MAIRHWFTVPAERHIMSREGKLTIVDMVLNVELSQIPGSIPSLSIIVGFTGDVGDPYSVRWEPAGEGESVLLDEGVLDESNLRQRANSLGSAGVISYANFAPATFPAEGIYHVTLRSGDEVINKFPVGVFAKVIDEGESDETP